MLTYHAQITPAHSTSPFHFGLLAQSLDSTNRWHIAALSYSSLLTDSQYPVRMGRSAYPLTGATKLLPSPMSKFVYHEYRILIKILRNVDYKYKV